MKEILREGIQKPKKGHDAGDHPPITPMRCADRGQFDHDSWRLYEYITKHFIGTVSERKLGVSGKCVLQGV